MAHQEKSENFRETEIYTKVQFIHGFGASEDKLVPISFPFPLRDSPDPLDLVSQAKTVSHGMMWLLMLTQPGQTNRSPIDPLYTYFWGWWQILQCSFYKLGM